MPIACEKQPTKQNKQAATTLTKSFMTAAYTNAAQQLIDVGRKSKNGRAPIGFMESLLDQLWGSGYLDTNRDKVNYHKSKLKKTMSTAKDQQPPADNILISDRMLTAISLGPQSFAATESSLSNDETKTTKQSGRPKGTTAAMKKEVNKRIEFCKMAIVEVASKVRQEQNIQGKCTKKGFLAKLIQEKKKEFGLSDDIIISPKTIQAELSLF